MAGRDVPMSVRRLIVEVNVDGLNVREFCQQHGVSTWFFYDLRRRWRRDGDAVLEPQSRAPKRVWNKTASDVEDAAVAIRKRLRDAGFGLRARGGRCRARHRGGLLPRAGDGVSDPQG